MAGQMRHQSPPRFKPWRLLVLLGGIGVIGASVWWFTGQSTAAQQGPLVSMPEDAEWKREKATYAVRPPPETPVPRNELLDELRAWRKEQQARDAQQDALLEELKKRPQITQGTAQPAQKPKPVRWTVADATIGKPPFPKPEAVAGEAAAGKLIQQALAEMPAQPERTLYRSQFIAGLTMDEIHPALPGQIRIQVSQPVYDKFGQMEVLVPQNSILIGQQLEVPEYGESRLQIGLAEIQPPDGQVIALKGQVADQRGGMGLRTSTDYRWGRLVAGTLLSAVLSVGSRVPFGNTDSYHPSIAQEGARAFGQSLNQTGQRIIDNELRALRHKPIPAGTAVMIQLGENISLAKAPVIIK